MADKKTEESPLSVKERLQQKIDVIKTRLNDLEKKVFGDDNETCKEVISYLEELEEIVNKLRTEVPTVSEFSLPKDHWDLLGQGNFGAVFKVTYQSSDAAIKIFTKEASSKLKDLDAETNLLRDLSHDNIIAFRGTGYMSKQRLQQLVADIPKLEDSYQSTSSNSGESARFLIMEYIETNLDAYVDKKKTPETSGLGVHETWMIGQKIANALNYLHSKDIVHRDLKPDNILYDPGKRILKVADFGLAWSNDFVNMEYASGSAIKKSYKQLRWGPPEYFDKTSRKSPVPIDWYKRGDIWCYGMIVAFLITGQKPFTNQQTGDIIRSDQEGIGADPVRLPSNLQPELKDIIDSCRQIKPEDRPNAQKLLSKYDKEMKDKFFMTSEEKEFFTCAFMDKTDIFVADCRVPESTYCHHRSMRDIWMKVLTDAERHSEVPCKAIVHEYYSTSFGLHVAILTDEGPGNPQKFIFCRRARRAGASKNTKKRGRGTTPPFQFWKGGVSSPGALTCGAVESCSVNDYIDSTDSSDKRVDLVKTAARGLHEELGLELTGSDLDAITLNTVYLKFDTHEWGMCGFVDLTDGRIRQEHRISAQNLEARFLGGAKDKFEHDAIIPIDFKLDSMVDFVFEKHLEFASSGKLVVVKVLQAYFGVDDVQRAFELKGK